MSVRLKRLQADHEQIKQGLRHHPSIRIRGVSGSPPDRYQIEYHVRSLTQTADGKITERGEHVAEIYLTLGYPKRPPQCRMLTPVFHPNIAPHAICVGDHWAAGESLLHLILRIGEMLAYQSYNTQSPLNGAAARWVDEHIDLLPTDRSDFSPTSLVDRHVGTPREGQCQNCHSADHPLQACANGHQVCPDCLVACARCGKTFCLLCPLETCPTCGRLVCESCVAKCPQCLRTGCAEHLTPCALCGTPGCPDCAIECAVCGRTVCLTHVRQCAVCRKTLCADHAATCSACGKAVCAEHFDAESGTCSQCQAAGVTPRPDCEPPPPRLPGLEPPPPAQPPPPRPAEPPPAEPTLFTCPGCQARLKLPPNAAGRKVRCPRCHTVSVAS